MNMSVFGFD